MKPEQLEIARLKREVIKLKAERDILKKAAAYFAKEPISRRNYVKFGFIAKLPKGSGRRIGCAGAGSGAAGSMPG